MEQQSLNKELKKILETAENLQGYLWYSDQHQPMILTDSKDTIPDIEDQKSFVIEGAVRTRDDTLYMIKHNGTLKINKFTTDQFEGEIYEKEKVIFKSHRVFGYEGVAYQRIWKEESIDNEDFSQLNLQALLFEKFIK